MCIRDSAARGLDHVDFRKKQIARNPLRVCTMRRRGYDIGAAVFKGEKYSRGTFFPGRAKSGGKAPQPQHAGAGLGDIHIYAVNLLDNGQGVCLIGRDQGACLLYTSRCV